MKSIAIIGAGSHTRSSINLLKQYFKNEFLKIFDDSFNIDQQEFIDNIEVVGKLNEINNDEQVFLSIGNNREREEYFTFFNHRVLKDNLIHKTVHQENNITMGRSNQIFANSYINSYVSIGDNNIINTSVVLEHEVMIGNHNHISVGAKICGRVSIGNRCLIGAGAIIIDKISICDDVIIGAGAVVVKSIIKSGTYVGNPERKIK